MKKFILILLLAPFAAQAQQIDITGQHIPATASFAQAFDMRFELSHTPGYTVELDKTSLPEGFELAAENRQTLSPGTAAYDLSFIPFTLGISTFTAVNFNLKAAPGDPTLAHAVSEPQTIEVRPVKYFKENTLRDIRPPYIPASLLIWLLIALTAALIIYFVRQFWHKIKASAAVLNERQDTRPPDIIALSKIQQLLQSGLWEKARYKTFYTELENILREYFWRRFALDVSSDTSAELLRRARTVAQLTPLLQLLRNYLNYSDLVKFAQAVPTEERMQRDVKTVQTVVEETVPPPPKQEDR